MNGHALVLALICLGLGADIYVEVTRTAPIIVPGGERPVPLAANVVAPSLHGDFSEIVNRPLFLPTRRPPVPEQAKAEPPPALVLTGVMLVGNEAFAVVRTGKPEHAMRLVENQEIDGWIVSAIEPNRIVLKRGAARHEVKLETKGAPPKR